MILFVRFFQHELVACKVLEEAERIAQSNLRDMEKNAEVIEVMLREEVVRLREQLRVSKAEREAAIMEVQELHRKMEEVTQLIYDHIFCCAWGMKPEIVSWAESLRRGLQEKQAVNVLYLRGVNLINLFLPGQREALMSTRIDEVEGAAVLKVGELEKDAEVGAALLREEAEGLRQQLRAAIAHGETSDMEVEDLRSRLLKAEQVMLSPFDLLISGLVAELFYMQSFWCYLAL